MGSTQCVLFFSPQIKNKRHGNQGISLRYSTSTMYLQTSFYGVISKYVETSDPSDYREKTNPFTYIEYLLGQKIKNLDTPDSCT